MAQRRMFSLQISDTDAFLDMSLSAQALYFHLGLRADDDGFVSNPKKIMRMLGSQEDDLKVLVAKRFILPFDSGICVIKHWKINNYIQKDRYTPTKYSEEFETLALKENGGYTEKEHCIQDGYSSDTQVRLGKVRKERESFPLTYLTSLPLKDKKEFSEKYNCSISQVEEKAEAIINYCESKGKRYKNYKATLRTWLSNDYGKRVIIKKGRSVKPY